MRSLIILNEEQRKKAFCEELKRYDRRLHPMNILFLGAHCGRITTEELYLLTFEGKFVFK